MKSRTFCSFMLALQILSWVSMSMRLSPPTNDAISSHTDPEDHTPQSSSSSYPMKSKKGMEEEEEYGRRGIGKVGSSPPRCEHKCYGCTPCEAIQVPSTSTRKSHLGIQYANYEPESWKCKCGPSFYSP
ncbi:EPIDERMAL PATTERNING FACTOR-like protein 3 [Senna tora]|uniref:Epidermal patterning factor-like protein n=1 Tax=Senna tora TaxID=362788 RepID=A0A834XDE2_9FABA|nr:EPIDERMAL PATTERNING FACTOR-like protein 3 [Senna tora]